MPGWIVWSFCFLGCGRLGFRLLRFPDEARHEDGPDALGPDDGDDDGTSAHQKLHPKRDGLGRREWPKQPADAVDGHHEEVRDQNERPRVEARQQRDGSGRVDAAQAEVVEASALHLVAPLLARAAEDLVQRVRQGVDGRGPRLALRVEGRRRLCRLKAILEVVQRLQHVAEQLGVVQCDRHATAGEWVPHVECVAQHEPSRVVVDLGWHRLVLHALQGRAVPHRSQECGAQTHWNLWRNDVLEVIPERSRCDRRQLGRPDVDQAPHLFARNGVEEDG
mmetsp:Transcript_7053/g.18004  ORF Transcript_7053/g.18004 Transcript_7053/m.18004 type:complete len:278 (-) Transcript_7053:848-1681(-)